MEEVKPNFQRKPTESSHENEPAFDVYLNEYLVAEVRGSDPESLTVIPMRELSNYEEDKLHEYIACVLTGHEY